MPAHPLSQEAILEAVEAVAQYGNVSAAARALNMPRQTLQNRLEKAGSFPPRPSFVASPVPSADMTNADLIAHLASRSRKHRARFEAEKNRRIAIDTEEPFAIVWFTDVHLGDNGCDYDLLLEHCQLVADTPHAFGVFMGDASNSWPVNGKLGKQWAEQETSKHQERQLVEWFLKESGVPWLFWALGNHDCLSEDTELLTKRGWISYRDIRPDDQVLSANTADGTSEWHPIEAVIVKEGTHLNRIESGRVDLACTDKHRILHGRRIRSGRDNVWGFGHAADLPKDFLLPVARPISGQPGSGKSLDEIRFAAWMLTDGHIAKSSGDYSIYQSKPQMVAHIGALLDRLGPSYSRYERQRVPGNVGDVAIMTALPQVQFRIAAESRAWARAILPEKYRLPAWAWDMTADEFGVFIHEIILGDGSYYPAPRKGAIIYGEKSILDEMQALCLMHGKSANVRQDSRGAWRLNLSDKQNAAFTSTNTKWVREAYEGIVWCLKVPLGNFMIRRNGKAHFTGNCWGDGETILRMMNADLVPMAAWGAKVTLEFANKRECRLDLAHDHKGHSMWNALHAETKTAQMGWPADFVFSGHRHTAALHFEEFANRQQATWLMRAKGYKSSDSYAFVNGFPEQSEGHAGVTVIDPRTDRQNPIVHASLSVSEGLEYLTFLRSR